MRILFLIRSLNAGGAERQLVTLANGLARMGHDIHVALFYRGGVFEDALDARVRIHSLDKRGCRFLRCLPKTIQIIFQLTS